MMNHFKITLKSGLQQGAIYFDFCCKKPSIWAQQNGQEHQEKHPSWTAEAIHALFTQFFPNDLESIQAGKPTRGILTIVNHGNLILLAHPGDEPRLEIFVPPHAEAKFEHAWRQLQDMQLQQEELPQEVPDMWIPQQPEEQAAVSEQAVVSLSATVEEEEAEPSDLPTDTAEEAPQQPQERLSVSLSAPMEDDHAIEVKKVSEPIDMPLGSILGDEEQASSTSSQSDEDELPSRSIPLTALSGGADLVELSFTPSQNGAKQNEDNKTRAQEMFSISHTQMGLNIWNVIQNEPDPKAQMEADAEAEESDDVPLIEDASSVAEMDEPEAEEVNAFTPPPPPISVSALGIPVPEMRIPDISIPDIPAPPVSPAELSTDLPMNNPFTMPAIEEDQTRQNPTAQKRDAQTDAISHNQPFAQVLAGLTQPGWWECFGLSGAPVFVRHDSGVERQMRTWPDREQLENLLLKSMPTSARQQWQEQGEATFCYGSQIRHRVRVIRSEDHIHIAVRALMQPLPTWEQLGLPDAVRKFADLNRGLVLVCGPSNSGRSTTLAALLNHITKYRKAHIQTLEQPVEYIIEAAQGHVWQQEVTSATNVARLLKQLPLSNPDIVMVSDVNHPLVLREALLLAEKGHLVFAGFTANTSMHAIERVIDLYPATEQAQIRHQIADNLRGVVAQLLLQKRTGGRVPACDVLVMNRSAQALIREDKVALIPNNVQSKKSEGHVVLHESIMTLVQSNVVDAREAQAKIPDRDTLPTPGKKPGSAA